MAWCGCSRKGPPCRASSGGGAAGWSVSTSTLYIPWRRRSSKALRPFSEDVYGWVFCAKNRQLGDTLPLPYAQGLAEDYARHLGVARLVEAEAPWRQHPATEKQTALLRKLGLAARAGLTKGEAAELLAAVLGDWD